MGQTASSVSDDRAEARLAREARSKETRERLAELRRRIEARAHRVRDDEQSQLRKEQSQHNAEQAQCNIENAIDNSQTDTKAFRKQVKRSIKRLGLDATDKEPEVDRKKLDRMLKRLEARQDNKVTKHRAFINNWQRRRRNRLAFHSMAEAFTNLSVSEHAEGGSSRDMVGTEDSLQVGDVSASGVGEADVCDCD